MWILVVHAQFFIEQLANIFVDLFRQLDIFLSFIVWFDWCGGIIVSPLKITRSIATVIKVTVSFVFSHCVWIFGSSPLLFLKLWLLFSCRFYDFWFALFLSIGAPISTQWITSNLCRSSVAFFPLLPRYYFSLVRLFVYVEIGIFCFYILLSLLISISHFAKICTHLMNTLSTSIFY